MNPWFGLTDTNCGIEDFDLLNSEGLPFSAGNIYVAKDTLIIDTSVPMYESLQVKALYHGQEITNIFTVEVCGYEQITINSTVNSTDKAPMSFFTYPTSHESPSQLFRIWNYTNFFVSNSTFCPIK